MLNNEFLHGSQMASKMDNWDREEDELNQKYHDFLVERPNRLYPTYKSRIDEIEHHYVVELGKGNAILNFRDDTDLPTHITDEIQLRFRAIFGD